MEKSDWKAGGREAGYWKLIRVFSVFARANERNGLGEAFVSEENGILPVAVKSKAVAILLDIPAKVISSICDL